MVPSIRIEISGCLAKKDRSSWDGWAVESLVLDVMAAIVCSLARKSSSAEASWDEAVRARIPYPSEMLQNAAEPIMASPRDLKVSF
jgi:hypothetical protein